MYRNTIFYVCIYVYMGICILYMDVQDCMCTYICTYRHVYVLHPAGVKGGSFLELLGNGVFCFVPLCQPIQFPTHTAKLYKVMNLASRYFKDTNVYNNHIATISCVYQHITPCCGSSYNPTPQLEGGGGMATAAKGFVQPPPEVCSFGWRLKYHN